MSPEQIQGGQVDVRSDIYSVGVSLYELVTGKKPFDAESQFAIMSAHLARAPLPPVELNPNLPGSVSEVILTALNKDPATRYQTAAEFLEALRNVQEEVGYGTATMMSASAAPRTNLRQTTSMTPREMPPLGDSLRMTAMQPTLSPPPTSAPAQTGTAPQVAAEQPGGSKRMIMIGAGALCVVVAIGAVIMLSKGKSGGKAEPTPFTVSEPQQTAAPQAGKKAAVGKPSALSPTVVKETPKQPARQGEAPTSAKQTPAPEAAAPAPEPKGQPAPQGQPASMADAVNKNRVEVQRLSEKLDMVYGRAKVVRSELQTRGDTAKAEWVESFNRLNRYLKQASAAVNDANTAAATEALGSAAVELDGLEKALGK
jgi:serine/threonine-protein kinase